MNIINLSRNERILFNQAKIKFLLSNKTVVKITNSKVITYLLKKYTGDKNATE